MELVINRYEDSIVYGGVPSAGPESHTNCDVVRGVNSAIEYAVNKKGKEEPTPPAKTNEHSE